MEDKLILGRDIAAKIDQEVMDFVQDCKEKGRRIPKIVNVAVGDNEASASYMKGLAKKCEKVNVELELITLDEGVNEFELIHILHKLNQTSSVDGILIQMPLPEGINTEKIVMEIDPSKDLDGLHPLNVGKFYQGQKSFVPCTALSAMEFIYESGINLKGKEVVVIGRSNVIGKPVAMLCLAQHASVTIVHSRSENIEKICQKADVLICAAGSPKLVKKDWVKKGAVIVDVGVNLDENGKLCGDVDLEDVIGQVSKISPVPRGVGVVTNSMLMKNLIEAYKSRR